ncbi:peptide maturation system acyl carrier-related protein [Clostridiaceae bacterium M8S5]|nr:peptide maturation system acyl carrier-related protein [Clostridiaceae bacterium M8S5]
MEKQNIKDILVKLIYDLFELDITKIDDYENKELLGYDIKFTSMHLLYLYFECEKKFKINIPQKDILEGKFNNINNISEVINRYIACALQKC